MQSRLIFLARWLLACGLFFGFFWQNSHQAFAANEIPASKDAISESLAWHNPNGLESVHSIHMSAGFPYDLSIPSVWESFRKVMDPTGLKPGEIKIDP